MSGFIYKNNANSLVVGTLAAGATTLNVTASEGSNFPSTFPFRLTIWDANAQGDPGEDSGMEVVHCTSRTTDALTIVRGQEGTADVEHTAGEKVAMLWTAGHFNDPTYGIQAIVDAHKASDGSEHSFIDQDVTNASSPVFIGTNVTDIPSGNVNFQKIGTPVYYTAQHWFDVVQSSGIIDGFEITAGDDITHIDISAGKGVIKIIDSELGTTKSFEIGATNELALTPTSVNYIYLDYNAGSPIVAATTDHSSIELNRMFDLGVVYSNTSSLHILSAGVHISNLARSEHERLIETVGFTYASGAAVTNSSLDILVSGGVWYYGHNRLTTDALDTTGADTFVAMHYGTSSWITDDGTASAINATKYNDGDDVLGDLTVNAYGVQWLYVTSDSDYYVVYGIENGTLAAAEAAVPPAQSHPYINAMGELIAKIIVRQTGVIVDIIPTQTISYGVGSVANHNELGNIDGGTAGEYFHMTSAQHTIATQAASTSLSGYLSTTDWNTFNNKAEADQTMYIGSTAVVINRATNPLTLAGITLTTPDIGTPSAGTLTNCTFPTLNQNTTGTAATVTGAAQTAITSLGILTTLQVDNININLNTISSTSGNLNISPVGGSAIVLDGTISIDAGVVTGATSITSTTFVGALTGQASTVATITGLAPDTATTQATQASITTCANLTTVGALNAGTITSAFGSINNGSSPITTTGNISGGLLNITTDIVLTEAADHTSTPGAGFGYMWVKNTTPSTLIFTDDGGTDTTLGSGGTAVVNIELPAEAAYLPATNPAALVEVAGATTYAGWSYLAFDDATAETAIWTVSLPNYDGGNIVVKAWIKPATTPDGAPDPVTVAFDVLTVGVASGEEWDEAVLTDAANGSSAIDMSIALSTGNANTEVLVGSVTINPDNVASGDTIKIGLKRNPTAEDVTNDHLEGDAQLLKITLEYTGT